MSDTDRNRAAIDGFWPLLYAKDWDGLAALFAPEAEYTDVPTPDDDVAHGPDQIIARLRLGLDPVDEMIHQRIGDYEAFKRSSAGCTSGR